MIKTNCKLHKSYEQLEQENAKLKSEKGCETCTKFDEVQLTKAKEIIRNCYSLLEEVFMLKKRNNEHAVKVMEEVNKFWEENE